MAGGREVQVTPREVLALIRERDVRAVDLRFMDFPGLWQHFTVPATAIDEARFEEGFGFDGSSVRGWQAINESDMLVVPESATALIDPFATHTTLALICNIQDPLTREDYTRDPRNVARKAVNHMLTTGIAGQCRIAPDSEFFLFDDVRFEQNSHEAYYHVDSEEAEWNRGRAERPNLGHKIRHRQGHFPVPPADSMADLRTEIILKMADCGIGVTEHHHESATAGQMEIDMAGGSLVETADRLLWHKYIVKNVARSYGKTATFMPKPLFGDYGSGLHTHLSLWAGEENLFAGSGYAGLSETAMHATGGLLAHARAVCAFTNPTTNSYKRLVPGYEAPVNLAYSRRNRSAAVRIPVHSPRPQARGLELRLPDGTCNPYLAFAAILMAMLDGIQNKTRPGEPLDKDIYDLQPEELTDVPKTPESLEEAIAALEADHEFLLRGDVFTEDVLDTWMWYKREHEAEQVRIRPHPYEFALYYDM